VQRNRESWLITFVVAVLPFSYVPHEITRIDVRLSFVVSALALVAGFRYKVFSGRPSGVELLAALLGFWAIARLVVIAPLDVGTIEMPNPMREFTTVGAGILLFRLAADPDLRPGIIRGLRIALGLMLAVEAYQLLVGLPALLAFGYESPQFNYNTAAGSYRPFGTFLSPVIFGTYLAMVGLAVILTARRWGAVLAAVATVAGLALTQTRSAWIGFGVGVVVAFLLQPRATRSTKILVLVPAAWLVGLAALISPALLLPFLTRLDSVSDTSDTSNSIRLQLWQGVLDVAGSRPVDGLGPADFETELWPYVGKLAEFGHPHNTYLQLLYLYGGVGVLLFVAVLVTMVVRRSRGGGSAYRTAATAAVVTYAVGAFFESTWTSFNTIVTLFLLAGLGAEARRPSPQVHMPRPGEMEPGSGLGTADRRTG
jgi:O-antigen ligase